MCIFEISKVLLYEFHYDYIENKYGKISRPMFREITSLIYENKTDF